MQPRILLVEDEPDVLVVVSDKILTGNFAGQVSVIDLARGQIVRTIAGPKGDRKSVV